MIDRPLHYALDPDGTPIPVANDDEGALLDLMHARRGHVPRYIVGKDQVGGVAISTVFLFLDHDHTGMGPPILWETGICRADGHWEIAARYRSQAAAQAGHAAIVANERDEQGVGGDGS